MGNRRSYRSCDSDQGHHGQGRRQLWDVDGHAMTRDTMDKEQGSYECRW